MTLAAMVGCYDQAIQDAGERGDLELTLRLRRARDPWAKAAALAVDREAWGDLVGDDLGPFGVRGPG